MGCRILVGDKGGGFEAACLYDSVTDTAFGPLFDGEAEAEAFCEWLRENAGRKDFPPHSRLHHSFDGTDAREYTAHNLATLVHVFREERNCPECGEYECDCKWRLAGQEAAATGASQ